MITDPLAYVLGSGLSLSAVRGKNGVVDTYNGTGLMNGSMDGQSKPGNTRSEGGHSLLVVVWREPAAVEKILRTLDRGAGLESDPLLCFPRVWLKRGN